MLVGMIRVQLLASRGHAVLCCTAMGGGFALRRVKGGGVHAQCGHAPCTPGPVGVTGQTPTCSMGVCSASARRQAGRAEPAIWVGAASGAPSQRLLGRMEKTSSAGCQRSAAQCRVRRLAMTQGVEKCGAWGGGVCGRGGGRAPQQARNTIPLTLLSPHDFVNFLTSLAWGSCWTWPRPRP